VLIKLSNKMNTSRIFISMNQNPVNLKYVSAMHSGCFIISPIDFAIYGFPLKKGEDYEMIDDIHNLKMNKIARNTDYNSIKQKIHSYNWLNISSRILSFVDHVEDIVKYTETITRQESVINITPIPKPTQPKPTISKSTISKPSPKPSKPIVPHPVPKPIIPKQVPKPSKPIVPKQVPKPIVPKPSQNPSKSAQIGGKRGLMMMMKGYSKRARAQATKSKKPSQSVVPTTSHPMQKRPLPTVTGKRGLQAMKAIAKSKKELQQMKKGKHYK